MRPTREKTQVVLFPRRGWCRAAPCGRQAWGGRRKALEHQVAEIGCTRGPWGDAGTAWAAKPRGAFPSSAQLEGG